MIINDVAADLEKTTEIGTTIFQVILSSGENPVVASFALLRVASALMATAGIDVDRATDAVRTLYRSYENVGKQDSKTQAS